MITTTTSTFSNNVSYCDTTQYFTITIPSTSTYVDTSTSATTYTTSNVTNLIYFPVENLTIKQDKFKVEGPISLQMPDDSLIEVDESGNYQILDKEAVVTYKATNVREFNKYINASDILEEFILFLGKMGAKQGEVLNVPIELFINWIIFRASQEDGEETEPPKLEANIVPRCNYCKRFISKVKSNLGINFCNELHLSKFMLKHQLE